MINTGSTPVQLIELDTSSTNITSGAYVELDDALDSESTSITILNLTGQPLKIARGPASSEEDALYVPASDPTYIEHGLVLSESDRLSVISMGATASSGLLLISLWK